MAHTYNTNKATLARGRSTSGRDLAVNVPSGATLLVCMIVVDGLTARTGGAPTWNSGAQTFLQADQNRNVASTGETIVEMWYLLAPASGNYNIHIPDANNVYFSADGCSFSAAAGKSTALRVANGATGTSTNPAGPALSGTLTGDVVLAVVGDGATTWAPSGRTGTQLYDVDDGTWGHGSQYYIRGTDATTTLTWTEADTEDWAIVSAAFKEVTVYTPLAAGIGAFPLSGTAAGFVRGLVVGAATKSFPLSGTAAGLLRARIFSVATQSFPLSGTATSLLYGRRVSADTLSFPLSGAAAGFARSLIFAADGSSFPLSGTAAGFVHDYVLSPATKDFPLSGTAAGFLYNRIFGVDSFSFSLAGSDAGLLVDHSLSAETQNFAWTGADADLSVQTGESDLIADLGEFPFSGTPASLQVERYLSLDSEDFPLVGVEVLFTKITPIRYALCFLIKA